MDWTRRPSQHDKDMGIIRRLGGGSFSIISPQLSLSLYSYRAISVLLVQYFDSKTAVTLNWMT